MIVTDEVIEDFYWIKYWLSQFQISLLIKICIESREPCIRKSPNIVITEGWFVAL